MLFNDVIAAETS